MFAKLTDECSDCGGTMVNSREIGQFTGFRNGTVTGFDGAKRSVLIPKFDNVREVCFSCYNIAARKEVQAARN